MNKKALVCLSMLALLSIMASTSGTQPYKLIVTTDKEGYTFGDTIIVEVKVLLDSTPIKGAIVGIELRDPNNNPVLLIIERTNESGIVRVPIKTSEKWPTGKYVIWVALSGTMLKATTSFFLIGLGPLERMFIALDNNGLPLVSAKVMVFDTKGKK